jgi:ribosomal protein S12 methylthiotransferase
MGCLSERYKTELQQEIPEVDRYYGKFDYTAILDELGEKWSDAYSPARYLTTPPHYAYLKIAEGCSRGCAYCAIPLITGKHRSRPMEEILEEASWLIGRGVREIQLIAQDLSYYGIDITGSNQLPELVTRLAELPGLAWLRLHYTYPHQFPMELLTVMREHPTVCRYLDMAFQHISDPVLTRMRRPVTRQQTYELIQHIREAVPGIHLRTTLMVGFPVIRKPISRPCVNLCGDSRFERMEPLCIRKKKALMPPAIIKTISQKRFKKARLRYIMSIQQAISEELNLQKIGQVLQVIIDREEGDHFVGRTEFDSPEVDPEVWVKKQEGILPGLFYSVKITGAGPYELEGRVV